MFDFLIIQIWDPQPFTSSPMSRNMFMKGPCLATQLVSLCFEIGDGVIIQNLVSAGLAPLGNFHDTPNVLLNGPE